jgi:tetraacyldisaccharide 4'-kinase
MASRKLRRTLSPLLLPFSLLYGFAVSVRNKLFDLNILKSTKFDFPVISVGNITVGGTGKTPHVEYLVVLLSKKFEVCVLSRGFKRKTKGFLLADKNSTAKKIGDEPYQMYSKFKKINIAVDEDRVHGIHELKKQFPNLQAVILDDAFQHRHVKPGVSILLIDFYRPTYKDCLLPAGDLRESKYSKKRANIVIVTKVPEDIKPIDKRLWIKKLNLYPFQYLYFTSFDYGKLSPVFPGKKKDLSLSDIKKTGTSVLLLTGIANPAPLLKKIQSETNEIVHIHHADHYEYSEKDLDTIRNKFNNLSGTNKIILTTEKDAIKLQNLVNLDSKIQESMYYLPIKVKFLDNKHKEFDAIITNYITTNKEINRLHK